ncbi:MAG: cation-translocating P-type ATPase, partial [Kiritimatiellae bacterium]|nr:cation-translocating P-type ATPase [Kiritimatiellia bacterium]
MGSCCGASAAAKAAAVEEGGFWAWAEKAASALSSWPALVVSGGALLVSFLLTGHGCGGHAVGWQGWRQAADPAWLPLLLCGLPVLKEAAEAIVVERRIRAALLISTAMVACVAIGQLFAAGEVAFIMAIGEKLEKLTVSRARKGLRKLVALVPQTARRVVTCPKCRAKGIFFKDVPVGEIAPGDGVMVRPGEAIPVDGTIAEGATSVDQSVMTGESLPVDKAVGDEVYSGTINRFGAITVTATKAGADGSLQKMIRLVREAEGRKAPMQRIADKWAAILVPASMTIALLTFAGVWAFCGDVHTALLRGVTVMVVFCPCALALATPTSVMAAIGQAAKYGVIVKSGEALERMGAVSVACFDKTGTLTTGKLGVAYSTDAETLALAASVEAMSEHPLAKAICAATPARPCEDFAMSPGRGVRGMVEGTRVACGTEQWMGECGVAEPPRDLAETAGRLRAEGKAVVFVAADGAV